MPERTPSAEDKKFITDDLQALVAEFNERFARWTKGYGCVANFAWGFDHDGTKKLELVGIDCIIHRKAPPNAETLGAVMKQYDPGK